MKIFTEFCIFIVYNFFIGQWIMKIRIKVPQRCQRVTFFSIKSTEEAHPFSNAFATTPLLGDSLSSRNLSFCFHRSFERGYSSAPIGITVIFRFDNIQQCHRSWSCLQKANHLTERNHKKPQNTKNTQNYCIIV